MSTPGPSLPYELLNLIVRYCDDSDLFTLTQVNTTFRRLVYENMPLPLHVPRNLAIHLINSQRHDTAEEEEGEDGQGLIVSSYTPRIESSRGVKKGGIYGGGGDGGGRDLEPPDFTLADYSPMLARNRWYRTKVVQIGGYGHRHGNADREVRGQEEEEETELSHDIFMLRCEARYERWMKGVSDSCQRRGHSVDVGACVICQMKARRELFKANARKKDSS